MRRVEKRALNALRRGAKTPAPGVSPHCRRATTGLQAARDPRRRNSVHPNGQPANAIALTGLTKRYGAFVAVKQLSLEVRAGEILGFLGLNGAGKTTTIRILLDLLRPTSGSAASFGHDCQSDSLKARSAVGYLP